MDQFKNQLKLIRKRFEIKSTAQCIMYETDIKFPQVPEFATPNNAIQKHSMDG